MHFFNDLGFLGHFLFTQLGCRYFLSLLLYPEYVFPEYTNPEYAINFCWDPGCMVCFDRYWYGNKHAFRIKTWTLFFTTKVSNKTPKT